VTFAFIDDHEEVWPVRLMCDALEVSTAGYYSWRVPLPSFAEQRRDALVVRMRGVHSDGKGRYGSPRVHAELVARGHDCCVNIVAKWRTCTRGGWSAGPWPITWKAASWSMPWSWRCSAGCRGRGCWRTPTEAASTPANTTNSSLVSTASLAA
jgi:hypothetical protein